MKLILFCLALLGRLGAAVHLIVKGDHDVDPLYFHESEYRLMANVKDIAADCEDSKKEKRFVTEIDSSKMRPDQKIVDEVEVCVLDWNNQAILENEHRYEAESPVSKMFYFLKHIASKYNDCGTLKYELSTQEDINNADLRSVHQGYDNEANEECGKIGLKKPLPEGGFAAMTVRIMKKREETLKEIRKNSDYFNGKFDKLEAAERKKWTDKAVALKNKAEEDEAKKVNKSVDEWREENPKNVNTQTALQLYKEDQVAALTKLLDKETITIGEIHELQRAAGVAMGSKAWRIFKNENNTDKADNEMETNPYYGSHEKVRDEILEFFRFQIRDIEKGKEFVEEQRKGRVTELIEKAKDLLREKELKKKKECDRAYEKWQQDNEGKIIEDHNPPKQCVYTEKTEDQLLKEAPEETLAHVSGWYGHENLPVNDCQLNEVTIDGQKIDFASSINSPRSLVRMLNVANHYNFQMLLDFSGAKLASVIHDNDLYRLRAMLGFDFLGDYTWESYIDVHGNRVSGIKEIEVKNPWFDKDSKNEKYHHSKDGERAFLDGIGGFAGKCHNVIIHGGKEHSSWKLEKKDYLENDKNLGSYQFVTEDGKDLPAEKLAHKFPSKETAYNYDHSNESMVGLGVKNSLESVDKNEQKILLDNIEENTEEAKQRKREEAELENAEAFRQLQEENEKKKEKLDAEAKEKLAKEAEDFKNGQHRGDSNENDGWGDDEMDDNPMTNENEMDDDNINKKR